MNTSFWGPAMWDVMFSLAMNYPTRIDLNLAEHREVYTHYVHFFNTIPFILPCKHCRQSSVNVIRKVVPFNFKGRTELMYSIYMWKALVNDKLNKQNHHGISNRVSPPFEDVYNYYRAAKA